MSSFASTDDDSSSSRTLRVGKKRLRNPLSIKQILRGVGDVLIVVICLGGLQETGRADAYSEIELITERCEAYDESDLSARLIIDRLFSMFFRGEEYSLDRCSDLHHYLRPLFELELNDPGITNLEFFRDLPLAGLGRLYIDHSCVEDLSVLSALPNLRTLSADNTPTRYLGTLVDLPRLTGLSLLSTLVDSDEAEKAYQAMEDRIGMRVLRRVSQAEISDFDHCDRPT